MQRRQSDGWWHRVGGANAMSLPAWLLTLPGALISAVLTSSDETFADAGQWLILGLVGHLLVGAIMLSAWLTVLGPGKRRSRPKTFALVLIIAGAARGWFIAVTAQAWELSDSLNLGFRMTSAIGTVLLWMTLATLIVDGTRRHRATMAVLQGQLDREQRLTDASVHLVHEYRESIVSSTQQIVTEQLEHAISLSADPEQAALHLRQIVDDVVRPLSHELERRSVHEDALVSEISHPAVRTHFPLRDYRAATFVARPFNPLLTAVIEVATIIYITIAVNGPVWGAVAVLGMGLVIAGLTALLRAAIGTRLERWSNVTRFLVVLLAWCVVALISTLVVMAIVILADSGAGAFDPSLWVVTLVVCMALVVLAQFAGAVDGAVASLRQRAELELETAAAALAWMTARLRLHAYLEQQELGRILHGAVQARIVSLALQLQLNPPDDPVSAIAELAEQVRVAIDERRDRPWRDALSDVQELWSDAIRLGVSVSAHATAMLDRDPVAAQAVVEVTREGITNAVRHGQADDVRVRITGTEDALDVVITDDGHAVTDVGAPGLGTTLLDAVCLRWSLTGEAGKTGKTLRAQIAATQQPLGEGQQ